MVSTFTHQPAALLLVAAVSGALAAWPQGVAAAGPALPLGPTLVQGQASFSLTGPALTITTGRNAAIDWQSFSIGAQASVRFEQPDASSQVLNRVLGRDASLIQGRLSSNGGVWLLNPYGVLFGRGAVVDVGSLVASTLDLRAAEWVSGQGLLRPVPGVAAHNVVNLGALRSSSGGRIVLVSSGEVHNAGTVESPAGHTTLASVTQFDVADAARPDIAVRMQGAAAGVSNTGRITADGGRIDLMAAMVNQSGVLRADGMAAGPGGSVRLQSRDAMALAPGSITSASGASAGGQVLLVGGTQILQGRIDAGSGQGRGGSILLAAPRIALLDGANVQADGAADGGTVRIGQALNLAGLAEPAAQAVFMGRQALVSADATAQGDGGSLWLWGGDSARVFGSFSARGGPAGGNGGFVETSALGLVAEPTRVDTQAPLGRVGRWLLDPLDIQITAAQSNNVGPGPDFSATGPGARVSTSSIASALLSSDVTISTDVAGADRGVISMVDTLMNLTLQPPQGGPAFERTLTLQANAVISFSSSAITSTVGRLNLRLLAGGGATDGIALSRSNINVVGDLTLRGTAFDATNSTLLAERIDLQASRVSLGTGVQPILTGRAAGDALVIRGLAGNVESFTNPAGGSALSTTNNNGRWLLYAQDPATTAPTVVNFEFKQYGASYPAAAAQGSGNGLLYATRPVLTVAANGVALDKVYDRGRQLGLSAQQLNILALTGFLGTDSTTPGATGIFSGVEFASSRAGVAVPLLASLSGGLPAISDNRRPVYGYGFSGQGLTGTITPAPLVVVGATVADRLVNGGTAAQVLSWSLAGILLGDVVSVAAGSANFISSSTGIGKTVTATAQALGGMDAGNYTLTQSTVQTSGNLWPLGTGPEQPGDRWPKATMVPGLETPHTAEVWVLPAQTEAGAGPLDFKSLSPWQASRELRARSMAMARRFKTSADALDANPTLARLPVCSDAAGALEGACVLSREIKEALISLWNTPSNWAGLAGTWTAPQVFEQAIWLQNFEPKLQTTITEAFFVRGDGSFAPGTPLKGAGDPSISASKRQRPEMGGATPLAVLVPTAEHKANPGQQSSGYDLGASVSRAPVCVTPQQQQSGECQRHAELERLGQDLKACERLTRDEQSQCLFSVRVKSLLRQREQEARLLSQTLQSREARNAQLPSIGRKWALVIGVGHYPKVVHGDGQPARLPAAEHDARAVAAELSAGMGYITSALINPSRAEVVQRLNMLAAIAQPGDSLLVYFSGYGFKVGQGSDAIWALADADPKNASTMLLLSDIDKMLKLIDARQIALVSDSPLAGQLRVKAVDHNPKNAPDAIGLLTRRATVAFTSGTDVPVGSLEGQGKSEFATQLIGVLQRVKTWHIGTRIYSEVFKPLLQAGRPYLPQYGAASDELHQQQADYIFERRELVPPAGVRP